MGASVQSGRSSPPGGEDLHTSQHRHDTTTSFLCGMIGFTEIDRYMYLPYPRHISHLFHTYRSTLFLLIVHQPLAQLYAMGILFSRLRPVGWCGLGPTLPRALRMKPHRYRHRGALSCSSDFALFLLARSRASLYLRYPIAKSQRRKFIQRSYESTVQR